ncbi:NAD(P)H-hydrate dehydratase [Microbacterium pygmaeum]|uniref:ADP-dependent (S)-NAD(P)H-hydrate dehydratase n=1 Tax=Microbacterium pygmaeum TaxID=370764 RepID=A0A1G7TVM1_9MICO|nr:NAD(P)H-hydrate dehydratase [Microbacterium pygmaeum]SDG39074.1 yjeF C-terminal region, hydroxyethylthiazole kinase-related [Microbacterium pygmaeum]
MSNRSERADAALLRRWGLPDPGDSKKTRGRVMVVGGSRRAPGAVLLAGEAALRVGAGRLGLVVPGSIDAQIGIAIPEAAIFALPERATAAIGQPARDELAGADAVLVGPGFDDPEQTRGTVLAVADCGIGCLVLDAFALGILPRIPRELLPATLILNPNAEEAAILLGRDLADDRTEDRADDVAEIARRFDAIVNCYGTIAAADGTTWRIDAGGPGLATSGSGDVLAGAIAGFAARGAPPEQAAVRGSWTHARAGDRLADRVGLGYLARDLVRELTPAATETAGGPGSDG